MQEPKQHTEGRSMDNFFLVPHSTHCSFIRHMGTNVARIKCVFNIIFLYASKQDMSPYLTFGLKSMSLANTNWVENGPLFEKTTSNFPSQHLVRSYFGGQDVIKTAKITAFVKFNLP